MVERLIGECDVVFMLMDSRESRWLPTVLARLHRKVRLSSLNYSSSLNHQSHSLSWP